MRTISSPIERLYRPTVAQFRGFLARGEPLVLEGVLDDWRAPETWTFEHLETHLGEANVLVQSWFGAGAREFDYRNVAFSKVIESTRNQGKDYLISSRVLERSPALMKDIRIPEFVGPRPLPPIVFIGPRGALTPLHYDLHHGLLAQVRGHKEVTLVPFRRRDVLRKWELRGPARLSESVFEEVAEVSGATPQRQWHCTLSPYELLFVPSCRHHCVRSLDPSISLSFTWHTPAMRAFSRLCKVLARV
jgi:hypothetical protein